jgi:hypothetical protein
VDKIDAKLAVIIADPHCGSTVGLYPPFFAHQEGNVLITNKLQAFVWEAFEEATGLHYYDLPLREQKASEQPGALEICDDGRMWEIIGDDPFVLILGGDLIEGVHHSREQIISPDIDVHTKLAIWLLKPFVPYAQAIWTYRGTGTHNRNKESKIAKELHSVFCEKTKDHCWETIQLRWDKNLTFFKHHMRTALRSWTRSMQYQAAIVEEQANAIKFGHEPPRIIVRNHIHEHGAWSCAQGMAITTPPLKAVDKYVSQLAQVQFSIPGITVMDFRNLNAEGYPVVHFIVKEPEPDKVFEL